MPVGMRVLGEGERQEMLDALSRSSQQIQAQLLGMPLVLETPSQVARALAAVTPGGCQPVLHANPCVAHISPRIALMALMCRVWCVCDRCLRLP